MTHDYPPLTGGGLALGVRELAGLLRAGHDVRVRILSSRLADHAADDRQRAQPDEPDVGYARVGVAGAVRAIRRADVVITHVTFSFRRLAALSLLLGPPLGKPTVCVLHTAPDHCDYNRLRHLPPPARAAVFALAARALRGCAAVVALGPAHAAAIAAAGLRVTHVAPLPVAPPGRYSEAFRQHAASTDPVRVIGFAGELSPLKGADALPGLLRALTPRHEFLIAGAGPLAGRLACCAAALPPPQRSRVVLAGPVPPAAMPAFYREVDCLVVPSRTEAHCRVILEAMLAGVIVLAAPTCGSADLISDGATGLLIRPDDPASVAAALAALAADPVRARLIRERAAAFAARLAADSRSAWRGLLSQLLPDAPVW
jgi:glycosyltransferase involved in cell wall biosynthesis